MKSLFLKIFVSFWLAQALFVVTRDSGYPCLSPPTKLQLGGPAHIRSQRGGERVRAGRRAAGFGSTSNRLRPSNTCGPISSTSGATKFSHRAAPDWADRVARGGSRNPHDGFIIPVPTVLRESRARRMAGTATLWCSACPPGRACFSDRAACQCQV